MTDLWWTAPGAGEPALVELTKNEVRTITLPLAKYITAPETIEDNPADMSATLYTYRTHQAMDPAAFSGGVLWNNTDKKISQKIDASKLPLNVPVVLMFRFRVNGIAGIDYRTAWVILRVVV